MTSLVELYSDFLDRVAETPTRTHLRWLVRPLQDDARLTPYREELIERLRERAQALGEPSVFEGRRSTSDATGGSLPAASGASARPAGAAALRVQVGIGPRVEASTSPL